MADTITAIQSMICDTCDCDLDGKWAYHAAHWDEAGQQTLSIHRCEDCMKEKSE